MSGVVQANFLDTTSATPVVDLNNGEAVSPIALMKCPVSDCYRNVFDLNTAWSREPTKIGIDGLPEYVYCGGVSVYPKEGKVDHRAAYIGFHFAKGGNAIYIAETEEEMGRVAPNYEDDERVILASIGGVLNIIDAIWMKDVYCLSGQENVNVVITSRNPEIFEKILRKYGIVFASDAINMDRCTAPKTAADKPESVRFTINYQHLVNRFFGELEIPE